MVGFVERFAHDRATREECGRVFCGDLHGVQLQLNERIDRTQRLCKRLGLLHTHLRAGVLLAVQVRHVHHVKVDEHERTHAKSRQMARGRRAQPAKPSDAYLCACELLLVFGSMAFR